MAVGSEPPWCPACEWNLCAAPLQERRGWQSRRRRGASPRSFGLDERLFDQVASNGPSRPGWSAGLLTVTVISVLLGAATIAVLVAGIVLVLRGPLLVRIGGALLVGLAVQLRPRLARLEATAGYKSRTEVPALFAVVDAVAAQLSAPRVRAVVLDESFGASCGRFGFSRRPVLVLGLPLWASLSAAGRLGLLAHQIAHLVDRDPEQSLVPQPALSTFGVLANALAGTARAMPGVGVPEGGGGVSAGEYAVLISGALPPQRTFESLAAAWFAAALKPFYWVCAWADHQMRGLAAHARQRAEYYADALAVDVAGSAAVIEYCQALLLHEPVFTTARRLMRAGAGLDAVGRGTAETITSHAGEIALREQHSMRTESSPLAGHPPVGRRLRMLRAQPTSGGKLTPATFDFAAADAQLADDCRRVARALMHIP